MHKRQRFQTLSVLSAFLHSSAYYLGEEAKSSSIPDRKLYSHVFYVIDKTSGRWLKEVKEIWSTSPWRGCTNPGKKKKIALPKPSNYQDLALVNVNTLPDQLPLQGNNMICFTYNLICGSQKQSRGTNVTGNTWVNSYLMEGLWKNIFKINNREYKAASCFVCLHYSSTYHEFQL